MFEIGDIVESIKGEPRAGTVIAINSRTHFTIKYTEVDTRKDRIGSTNNANFDSYRKREPIDPPDPLNKDLLRRLYNV